MTPYVQLSASSTFTNRPETYMDLKLSPFEMKNEDLIVAFMTAISNADAAREDITSTKDISAVIQKRNYLSGAILARMEGIVPPFQKGDPVRLKHPAGAMGSASGTVERFYYFGEGMWRITLLENQWSYPATNLEKTIAEPVVA